MGYDEELADRIRNALRDRDDVTEKEDVRWDYLHGRGSDGLRRHP